jgi:peptidoglycan hydrolase-like protein with peptidoglycan-binding domain
VPSIILYQTAPATIAAVRALLASAGLALDGELPPANAPSCLNANPVLLVLLDPDLGADAGLEAAMIAAANAGRRIIGIWPKGTDGDAPPAFKKYSADQVIWDAARLRKAICGMDEPSYDTPTGAPQDAPPTDRNC